MPVTAKLKHLRISPRKVRLVANLIKGLDVEQAKLQLKFLPKRAAEPVLKLLNSAMANAENNFKLSKDNLFISKIVVEAGPILKRWLSRAMGRATMIKKRTSHLTIVLDEKEPSKVKPEPKAEKPEPEVKPEVKPELAPAEPAKKPDELERPFVMEKPEEKAKEAPKKTWQQPKKPVKEISKRRGFGDIARRIFRRKSI